MTPPYAESEEELKRLLKVKEESEKAGLKLNIQETNKGHDLPPHHFTVNRCGNNGQSDRLFFGPPNHCEW